MIEYCKGVSCPLRDNCARYVLGMNAKEGQWLEGDNHGSRCDLYMGN